MVLAGPTGLLIGAPREPIAVRDLAQPDWLFVGDEPRAITAGTTLEVQLAPDPAMQGIAVRCQLNGASTSGGIDVSVSGTDGWTSKGTLHPRRAMDQLGLRTGTSERVRLHFSQSTVFAGISQVMTSAADLAAVTLRQLEISSIADGTPIDNILKTDGVPLHLEPGAPLVGRIIAPERVEGSARSLFLELVGRVGTGAEPEHFGQFQSGSQVEYQFALQLVQPNPSRGQSTFSYSLARAGRAELEIFDLHGARIRTLVQAEQGAGAHVAAWDGRKDNGTALKVGTYFVRLTSGQKSAMKRFVLLR